MYLGALDLEKKMNPTLFLVGFTFYIFILLIFV
jgi:hypothetical protein